MTLEEYTTLEQEFSNSGNDVRSFLEQKGISHHTYYYWKRKSRELKEESSQIVGQFLPIDVQGGLIKSSKRSKSLKQPLVTQGEIEIELRTPAGAEIRIRGYMDSIMVSTIIASSGGRRNV
ncbi:MAG TPA: hypothetical protein VK212_03475 [Lentimicrobium sp.]|nr:hypothetical protein [Lentimicrobium sp.]